MEIWDADEIDIINLSWSLKWMTADSFEDYTVGWYDYDIHENQKSHKETDEPSQESVMS